MRQGNMGIAEYLKPENIVLGIGKQSRSEVFLTLAEKLASSSLLQNSQVDDLVQKLEEREALSTTGVGEGIAIPHASLDSIADTAIALGVVPDGVDFQSVDDKPADVIFMIVGSQKVPRQHIQILAKIVRLCRNKDLMKTVRTSSSRDEVLEAIRMLES
jgi:PTS system fructose-specific IIC component